MAAGFHASTDPTSYQAEEHIKTINAITNLATATATDLTAVANLTTTNAVLERIFTPSQQN